MIIDSSALVGILEKEPEALRLTNAIGDSPVRWLPASCFLAATFSSCLVSLGAKWRR